MAIDLLAIYWPFTYWPFPLLFHAADPCSSRVPASEGVFQPCSTGVPLVFQPADPCSSRIPLVFLSCSSQPRRVPAVFQPADPCCHAVLTAPRPLPPCSNRRTGYQTAVNMLMVELYMASPHIRGCDVYSGQVQTWLQRKPCMPPFSSQHL